MCSSIIVSNTQPASMFYCLLVCSHTHSLFSLFVIFLYSVAPAPEITNLTAINSTAIQVSWQPPSPEDVPGMIVNYIIMYAADGAERMIASPER